MDLGNLSWILLPLLCVLAAAFAGWFLGSREFTRLQKADSFANVGNYLSALRSTPKARFLVIELDVPNEVPFLQVTVTRSLISRRRFRLDYPICDWSRPFEEDLRRAIQESQFEFSFRDTEEAGAVEGFLLVDLGTDAHRASEFLADLGERLGAGQEVRYTLSS